MVPRKQHPEHDRDERTPQAPPRLDPEREEDLGALLEATRDEAGRNLAAAQRWQAEFENYKRRQERDSVEMRARAGQRMVEELLPVLDDLDRTIDHTVASTASGTELEHLLTGVEMVRSRILGVFGSEGVTVIDPFGQAFDPHLHQALAERPDPELPEHTVVEVYQKGYALGGRVLRPATVVVSTGGPEPSAESPEA
jgi:molecular chaperone GrpE